MLHENAYESYLNEDILGSMLNFQYLSFFDLAQSNYELGYFWSSSHKRDAIKCFLEDNFVCAILFYYMDIIGGGANKFDSMYEIAKILYKGSKLIPRKFELAAAIFEQTS